MAVKELGPFRGIDARPGAADQPGALLEAKNVIVGADGSLVRRPALVFRATLPADVVDIYAVGDQLRALAPYNITNAAVAAGTNLVGATTLEVDSTTGFPASGTLTVIDGTTVRDYTYTGTTATTFTGIPSPGLITAVPPGAAVRNDDAAQDNVLQPTVYMDYMTDPTPKVPDQLLGVVQGSDGRTVALVRMADESTALHRCPGTGEPPLATTAVAGLGFTPDFSLLRAAGRAWVLDGSLRYLRHSVLDSGTPESLVDFTSGAAIDAIDGSGFVNVSQFTTGVGAPQGLVMFGGRIVVIYRSALLIYRIDVDKTRMFLDQQITGPGTSAPRSAVELGADTIFLSDAGVRVISTVMQTLDAREDAIGGRIDHLARAYAENLSITPVGHYARRLGCYLLAFGQDVLCLSLLPGSRILGWTRWRLPVVVDGWADTAGTTWVRSGTSLYSLSDAENQDETADSVYANVPVLVETLPYRGTMPAIAQAVSAVSTEPVRVQVIADGRPGVDSNEEPVGLPITLPPRAPEPVRAIVGKLGRTFSVRVYDAAAHAGWRLDNLWLDVKGVR